MTSINLHCRALISVLIAWLFLNQIAQLWTWSDGFESQSASTLLTNEEAIIVEANLRLVRQSATNGLGQRNKSVTEPIGKKPSSTNDAAIIAGLAQKTGQIKRQTWDFLIDMSCRHLAPVHIIVAELNSASLKTKMREMHQEYFQQQQKKKEGHQRQQQDCAPIWIELQDSLLPSGEQYSPKRVVRLAQIRDVQRNRIRSLLFEQSTQFPDSSYSSQSSSLATASWTKLRPLPWNGDAAIILIDMDMATLPTGQQLFQRVHWLAQKTYSDVRATHVICSSGTHVHARNTYKEPFYYDTFATVLYPDTFPYPTLKRFFRKQNRGENTSLIPRSIHSKRLKRSSFTQYSLSKLFLRVAQADPDGLFPLRSCFGGVAIYKAATWLTKQCQYTLTEEAVAAQKALPRPEQRKTTLRYANGAGFPCEHVVFNECLVQKVFRINTSLYNSTTDHHKHPRQITMDPINFTPQWKGTPPKKRVIGKKR